MHHGSECLRDCEYFLLVHSHDHTDDCVELPAKRTECEGSSVMIAVDMDGTLLRNDKSLSAENVRALREAHFQHQRHIVIATGRMDAALARYHPLLGDLPTYTVTYNGARCAGPTCAVSSVEERAILHEFTVDSDLTRRVCKFAQKHRLFLNLYIHGKLMGIEDPELRPLADFYTNHTGAPYEFFSSYEEVWDLPSIKLLIVSPNEEHREEVMAKLFQELGPINAFRSNPEFCEILPTGVNKGVGLQALCEELGVPMSEVIAFGDSENDVEMLSMAGCGIAVANSRDSAKTAACKVSQWTNEEDCVAQELDILFQKWQGVSPPSLEEGLEQGGVDKADQ